MEDNFNSSDSTGIQQSCYCCSCYVALWGEYDKNHNGCTTIIVKLQQLYKEKPGKAVMENDTM